MWALDPDVTGGGDNEVDNNPIDKVSHALEFSLKTAFAKDKIFS